MKTTLVIMAAGLGSRFGGGIKQLEPVGLHDEIIMDYSIHDALQAGFNKIVIIIRKDIEEAFRERIGDRIEKALRPLGVEICYAYQSLEDIPGKLPEGRTKPWGTGQAVLAAAEYLTEPFAVINADDYYGKSAFEQLYAYLNGDHAENTFCMAGFILKNTLSENGEVTRGVCQVNDEGMLTKIVETPHIRKTEAGAEAEGVFIDPESPVSMNMWGLTPAFVELLKEGFQDFFALVENGTADPMKAEFLLPILVGELLKAGRVSVKVLETQDKWFGVTYKEDKAAVAAAFRELIADGVYKEDLFSDLHVKRSL